MLKPGPLDIAAEAFEPARRDGSAQVDPAEEAKATPAPDPSPRAVTPLRLELPETPGAPTAPSAEPGAAEPSPRSRPLHLDEHRETVPSPALVPVDLAPPPRQQLVPAEPAEPEFDPLPGEQEEPRSEPQPMPNEARGGPAVSIGEIVIEVREPFQAVPAQAQRPSVAPSSAAAASLIGPLPVRRSAISLYGMRRR
jgi:hypothetical protein